MSTSEDNFSLVDAAEGLNEIRNNLKRNGYALINQVGLTQLSGVSKESLGAIEPTWNELPNDRYLKDGGHYRVAGTRASSSIKVNSPCTLTEHTGSPFPTTRCTEAWSVGTNPYNKM